MLLSNNPVSATCVKVTSWSFPNWIVEASARNKSENSADADPSVVPSALVGNIDVPKVAVLITGAVKVLFVSVSVVALPTNVSVEIGNVTVTSPVGFPGDNVSSCASAEEPSNTRLPVIVPPNAIVSVAASPKVIVPPLNVDVPVTVRFPPIPASPVTVRLSATVVSDVV